MFYAKCKYVADIYKGTVEVDKEYYIECRRENCLKIKGKFYPSNMFDIIEIKYPMEIFSNLFSDGTVYDERFIDNLQHKNYMADFIMFRKE